MAKKTSHDRTAEESVMELGEFVRTALKSIIRGMKDLGEGGYTAEGKSIRGKEANIDFKVSLRTMKDGRIYVANVAGKANPNNNRIEFSIKLRGHEPLSILLR